MPWETSNRRDELPSNWDTLREQTRQTAGGRCQWTMPNGGRCPEPGTDCDHAGDPDDHSNLQWLCRRHHKMKTAQESAAARRAILAKVKHPVERPPGLL